jgi:hypothetical protein
MMKFLKNINFIRSSGHRMMTFPYSKKIKKDNLLQDYIQTEEKNKKNEEIKKIKREEKKKSLMQCLVLHPVFTDEK